MLALLPAGRPAPGRAPPRAIDYSCGLILFKAPTAHAARLTALRFAIAGPLLLPIVLRRGLAIGRLGWPGFVAVAAGAGAPVALVIGFGLRFAPVDHAGALYQGVVPLAVACLAAMVLNERVTAPRKVGLLLVVCGGAMVSGQRNYSEEG